MGSEFETSKECPNASGIDAKEEEVVEGVTGE